jgi:CRISPR system Cascade subunit CasB
MTTEAPVEAVEQVADSSPERVVMRWWSAGISDRRAPAGPRAELRRARTVEEVFFAPLFHELRHELSSTGWTRPDRLALVAGVLAHVRDLDASKGIASQMAAPRSGGAEPRVAPTRFRRLLRLRESGEELDQLFNQLRRALALLDHRANVADLARSCYWWGPETRRRWSLKYYELVNERSLKND